MAAEILSAGNVAANVQVTIYDAMPTIGRKFLMAGRGGLNLTHSEDLPRFRTRYGACADVLAPAIEALPPEAVRAWCEALGQETFVGTSGRVFPRAMKASPLLRAWLQRLGARGVALKTRHRWQGWDEAGRLLFVAPEGPTTIEADATVLALGGGSWPGLGSDGRWVETLHGAGVKVAALQPSNCGFLVGWSDVFRARFEGQPLKRITIGHGEHNARGEVMFTANGIEGGAVYALSPVLREAIAHAGEARITMDLRPDTGMDDLVRLLGAPRQKQSLSSFLRKAGHLSPVAIGLLQEAALTLPQKLGQLPPAELAALIKAVPVRLTATAPMQRAISTAGGVTFEEIDARFMLQQRPGVFVAGEMLDWEAPTGGYLLQACFATGAAAGRGVLDWLATSDTAKG